MSNQQDHDEYRPWCPPVDVHRSDHHYTVLVDLPGMHDRHITVIAGENTLKISGERPFTPDEKASEHLRLERLHGRFVCEVHLPGNIRAKNLETSYGDGVLSVTVPLD